MSADTTLWMGAVACGFLLGSIPVGLWWGRLVRGIDVREEGSRNLGATNVFRVLGPIHGIAVLLFDIAKGIGAVLLARAIAGDERAALLAGLAAVLGHLFSPWVRFRGGKGVATGLGIWIVLVPQATAVAVGVFMLVLLLGRRVSAASLIATLVLLPAAYCFAGADLLVAEVSLAFATALLVWIRHRGNLGRLLRGEEQPLWGGRR